jgi:predicted nucleotidyltransferase
MDELEGKVREDLAKNEHVISAYFIGSVVRGEETPSSDFDLAVVVDSRKLADEHVIYELLNNISFPRDLDLSVVDKRSSPLFLFQIISKGKRVYSRQQKAADAFEAFAMHNYYDTQHMRNIYNEALKEKFYAS